MLDKDKIAVIYEVFWGCNSLDYTTLEEAKEWAQSIRQDGFTDQIRIKRITDIWLYDVEEVECRHIFVEDDKLVKRERIRINEDDEKPILKDTCASRIGHLSNWMR